MKAVLAILLFLTSLQLPGQTPPAFTARAEFPVRNLNSEHHVFALPDSAVLVLNHESFFRYPTEKFSFFKLNQHLTTVWQLPVELPKGAKFARAGFGPNTAYLLFQTFKSAEWLLLRLHLGDGTVQISQHRLPQGVTFTVTELKILNGFLFLAGRHNDRLTVLHLDPNEDSFTKLPAIYDQLSALSDFHVDSAAKRAEFVLAENNGVRARLQVKRLTELGELYSLNFIQGQRERNFLAGRLSTGDSTGKLVIGTYSHRDLRYAQGFFVAPLMQNPGQKIRFYDFTEFRHYFDYLNPKRRNRLRRKISQLNETRKTYRLRKRILLHALRPFAGGYLLVGELYMPQYQGTAGAPRVFEGYDFQQTLICAFNNAGEMMWENSFPLKDLVYFELQEATTAAISGEKVMVCYSQENKLRYKVFSGAETTSNELFIEIEKALPMENIYNNQTEGIKAWFGPHLLVFGSQQVRSGNGNRHVYRIDKLSFGE